jgi:hypothetical protein
MFTASLATSRLYQGQWMGWMTAFRYGVGEEEGLEWLCR